MQRSLYFPRLGNKLYTITVPKTGRSCIVGMKSPETTRRFNEYVSNTNSYKTAAEEAYDLFSASSINSLDVAVIDFHEDAFYRMLKLNNYSLLVCDDFHVLNTELSFDGSLIDKEYEPDDEHRMYFERLLNMPYAGS